MTSAAPDPAKAEVTRLLALASEGDQAAAETLLRVVYQHLRTVAAAKLRGERRGHTLVPTALVSEAYLRLVCDPDRRWNDRLHFFNAAAQAMRRILVDHARRRAAGRRALDGRAGIANLYACVEGDNPEEFLALDRALLRLEEMDSDAAQVVRLRFFAGLSVDETARALGRSPRSIDREWQFARAWLFERLRSVERDHSGGETPSEDMKAES